MWKKGIFYSIPFILLAFVGCKKEQETETDISKKVPIVSNQTVLDDKKVLCSNKTLSQFLPPGNFTLVYKNWYNGACRVVAFYPKGDTKNHRLWYDLFIYRSYEDKKVYGVYGVAFNNQTFTPKKEELEAIKKFKQNYWEKLIARSIKMLKNFKVLNIIGNGTQTAYIVFWSETYQALKKRIDNYLKKIAEVDNLKIKILAPQNGSQILYNFKLPFNLLFLIKGDKFIPTKIYIPADKWYFQQMKEQKEKTSKKQN